jgi:hypothetical protein
MKASLAILATGTGLFLAAMPILGHHAFAAEYDSLKPVTLKGTFTKMDWINPHSWVYFDVKDADGKTVNWRAEALPPNGLYRQGWRRDSLKPGDEILVEGYLAKDGGSTMWSRTITTADGRKMFAGNADASPGAPPSAK